MHYCALYTFMKEQSAGHLQKVGIQMKLPNTSHQPDTWYLSWWGGAIIQKYKSLIKKYYCEGQYLQSTLWKNAV